MRSEDLGEGGLRRRHGVAAVTTDLGIVLAEVIADLVVGAEGRVQRGERGEEQLHVVDLQRDVFLVGNFPLPGNAGAADAGIKAGAEHVDAFRVLEEIAPVGGGGEQAEFARAGGDGLGGRVEPRVGRRVGGSEAAGTLVSAAPRSCASKVGTEVAGMPAAIIAGTRAGWARLLAVA